MCGSENGTLNPTAHMSEVVAYIYCRMVTESKTNQSQKINQDGQNLYPIQHLYCGE